MAVLAILLLGVGSFGIIAGIVSHNWFWLWVSAIGFLAGVIIGLKRLEKEGVFKGATIDPRKLAEAEKLFPMPKFTSWYLFKFKSRVYAIIMAGIVLSGVILTAIKAEEQVKALVTFTFLGMIVFVAILHTVAWVMMRKVEAKRMEWIGLKSYKIGHVEFINSWKSESKKWDRLAIKLRIGKVTFLDVYIKIKPFTAGIILLNYGLKTKNKPIKK